MKNERLKSLDIIKGIAMLMIIIVHYNQAAFFHLRPFEFGQMGCQFLFVVSGFSVAKSFERRLSHNTYSGACKSFYLSRLKSIAPAYYFMMLLIFIVNTFFLRFTGKTMSFSTNREPISILLNILFLNGLFPFCNNTVMPGGWYIGTTMILYLLTPMLYHLFVKFYNKKTFLCVVLSAISVSILVIVSIIIPGSQKLLLDNDSFGYFSFLCQFPCFCMGILLFFNNKKETSRPANYSLRNALVGTVFLVLSVILYFNITFKYKYILVVTIVGLSAYFFLNALIVYEKQHSISKYFNPAIKIGQSSLFVYLVHFFFAYTLMTFFVNKAANEVLSHIHIEYDKMFAFIVFIPIVVLLSYYSGLVVKWIVTRLTKLLHIS